MSGLLWRAGLRHLLHHPWQLGLSLLGIALGVAVVVAVDLANASASRAFDLAAERTTGRATHQVRGGPSGVPDSLYARLRLLPGGQPMAPVVEGYVALPGHGDEVLHLFGVDPFAEGAFRSYGPVAGLNDGGLTEALLIRPGAVLLGAGTARRLGLGVGESFEVAVGGLRRQARLVGLLDPSQASPGLLQGLMAADVATAQELLGRTGYLDHIDLRVPEGPAGHRWLDVVRAELGPGQFVAPSVERVHGSKELARALQVNLTALSLLALVVGMFLIYNTMVFAVLQRRPLLGRLRALGVTRREVFALVLGEALLLGAAGTAVGLALGVVLGQGLVGLVTRTINDLYFVLTVREFDSSAWSLAKGLLLGLGATLVAALSPAREAADAPPQAVLQRSRVELGARRRTWLAAALGVVLLATAGVVLMLPSRSLWLGFAGLFLLIVGCALLAPAALVALLVPLGLGLRRLRRFVAGLAVQGMLASLSRTGVATAALMVAVAATVAMGIMVGSFRATVQHWLESSLQADLYVAVPGISWAENDATLDTSWLRRLADVSGVREVGSYRRVRVEADDGYAHLVVLDLPEPGRRGYLFKARAPDAWARFDDDGVLVTEPYAYRHGYSVGDELTVRTDAGPRGFPIVGVIYDYRSDQGVVIMSRSLFERHWGDRRIASMAVYAEPGVDLGALSGAVRRALGSEQALLIRDNESIREASLTVFDRTFVITGVLRLLAMAIAFVGVLSAVMAVHLERYREVAVLRAIGLLPAQVWTLVLVQSALMGGVAGLLALPTGWLLAVPLLEVINPRAFGWSLQMVLSPEVFVQAFVLALAAGLLAGLYPALRMSRTRPAHALRAE